MVSWCINTGFINVIIYLFSGIGLVSLTITGIVYSILIKSSQNMAHTKSVLLKQITLKYENCYKLKLYTHEVQAFIDRYVYKKKIFKLPLYLWEHLALEMLYAVIVFSLLGTFINIIYYQQENIVPLTKAFMPGIIGFGLAACLLVVKIIFAVDTKKSIFYSNITDYLENILKNKLEQISMKEADYEDHKKVEKMATQNDKDQKDLQYNKENLQFGHHGVKHLSEVRQKQKTRRNADNAREGLIDDILNQLIT